MVAGHVADKASVLAWRLERWEVPRSVIDDPDRKSALTDAMRLAEGTAISLSKVVWRLAAELIGQNRSREDVSAVASGLPAERTYWTTLSGAFQGYLHELGQDRDRAEMTWRNAVAEAVSAASDAAYRTIGNDVKAIRAWAKVGPAFNGLRARALGPKDAVGGEAA